MKLKVIFGHVARAVVLAAFLGCLIYFGFISAPAHAEGGITSPWTQGQDTCITTGSASEQPPLPDDNATWIVVQAILSCL